MSALCLVLFTLNAADCGQRGPSPHLVLATTTSVVNSGLLDVLAPAWHKTTGIELRPALAGSGRALNMLANGQADVAISHAPGAEAAMLGPPRSWRYRKFMFNDFVLVGPAGDPARIAAESTLEGAIARLVSSGAVFVTRGDQSGTHEREQALWKLGGAAPSPAALITSGAGMAVTLRQASDRGAYTLSDRATFEQLKSRIDLQIVFAGDSRLLNTYAVIVDRTAPRRAEAVRFADWLVSGEGRDLIAGYRIAGSDIRPFTVWPERAQNGMPYALPH